MVLETVAVIFNNTPRFHLPCVSIDASLACYPERSDLLQNKSIAILDGVISHWNNRSSLSHVTVTMILIK